MASDVLIANLALDAIGTRSTIAAISENSEEARAISRQFDNARDDCLAAAHWNFARKQIALTLLKDGSLNPPDDVPAPWLYEYAYPADCIGCRYVMPSANNDPTVAALFGATFAGAAQFSQGRPVRFIVSTDLDSQGNPIKVILTNQAQAVLVYTWRNTDPNLYDSMFVRALANYLGFLISTALTGDKALTKMAFQIADATTKGARANNGNEGITVIDSTPDWIAIRGFEADYADGYFIQSPVDLPSIT